MMLKFYIPHKLPGERIISILRPHWFIILKKLLFWGIIALMPLIFYLVFRDSDPLNIITNNLYPFTVLFVSIYYLYLWLFIFVSFVDYYLDTWIITNQRIINIEQKRLFSRAVSEQKLYRVQDVTSEVSGFFATTLNYGDVYIQTAGETPRFIFKKIPDPYRVARKVSALVEFTKKYQQIFEK